ncbi:MAG: phosphotransferase [Planctomycetota bacterium]|nr:phosphotransferase [Planctomycetota bacterium]
MNSLSRAFPNSLSPIIGAPQLANLLAELGLCTAFELSDKALGVPITTSRSTWVRQHTASTGSYFVKTYDYPSAWSQCRGWLRNTGPLCRSRAASEAKALIWLKGHGLPAPRPVVVLESRRFTLLTMAVVVTTAFPGCSLDHLLPTLPMHRRLHLAKQLGCYIRHLHQLGFRDRNLDLRNLLARELPDQSFELTKIDSGRHRIVPPGHAEDRLTRADWARLLPQLAQFGIAAAVRAAATT